MNREQFNSALSGISDGLIEEAAGAYEKKSNQKRTLLQWAAAGLAERHRRKTVIAVAAAGLCLAVVLAAAGAIWGGPAGVTGPTQPTISMENPTTAPATQPETTEPTQPETTAPQQDVIVETGNVYLLSHTEEAAELSPMQADVTIPLDHVFRIRDLRDLSDQDKYLAQLEETEYLENYKEEYRKLQGEFHVQEYRSKKLILQQLCGGYVSVIIRNQSEIESIQRETTGVLVTGESYVVYTEEYTQGEGPFQITFPADSRRLFLECTMSTETRNIFVKDPSTPFSTISDTVTITINYKNGTKEIVMIDITVDDNGQIYMTHRGNNTGV